MEAVRSLLDPRSLKNPSTECIMEGLEICLLHNNSGFANIHLLQIVLQLEHQTHVLIPIKQLVILIRSLMKRELHNFRDYFILVDIVMTVWFNVVELSLLKKFRMFSKFGEKET